MTPAPSADRQVFRQREGVVSKESQGTTVLLRLSDGAYYTIDGVGAAIWGLCDGVTGIDGIVEGICASFDAPAGDVRPDVVEFIDELVHEGLLERCD